jgi:glycosyltransferase involved in cell wall biosynthesis
MLSALALTESPWLLSVIGDGPELDRLKTQASQLGITDRVKWHGGVANASAFLAAFDAFVLSSRTEGTPIALLEAMNARIPIVATSVGGVPDVVGPAHALLVPSEQPQEIASALRELSHNPFAAKERSEAAKDRLTRGFSPRDWMAAVERVYRAAGV